MCIAEKQSSTLIRIVMSIVFSIGRKKTLIISLVILLLCEFCMSIVPWWPLFAVLFFCCGAAHPGIYVNAVVLAVEIVSPKYRLYASAYAGTLFSIGVMILGSLAWWIRHYQILLMSISLPITACLLYLW
uniref:Uncharacterized protein n=1 Tax=Romanomermis culicivorax TaxID=13658 RepID=A0A915I839_ROMCU